MRHTRDDELSRPPSRRVAGIQRARSAADAKRVSHDRCTCRYLGRAWQRPAGAGRAVRRRRATPGSHHNAPRAQPERARGREPLTSNLARAYRSITTVRRRCGGGAGFRANDLPASLAGLRSRDGEDPGAVGIYGRGPTTLIALPLRGRVAGPLRRQLSDRGSVQLTDVGILAPVGPVGVLLTPFRGRRGAFLLAGTVNSETLQRAAAELLAGL